MVPTDLEPADLEPAAADEFAPAGDLELRSFTDLDLSGRDGSNGRLLECALTNCRADGLVLAGTRVLETSFDGVAATAVDAQRSTWRDVTMSAVLVEASPDRRSCPHPLAQGRGRPERRRGAPRRAPPAPFTASGRRPRCRRCPTRRSSPGRTPARRARSAWPRRPRACRSRCPRPPRRAAPPDPRCGRRCSPPGRGAPGGRRRSPGSRRALRTSFQTRRPVRARGRGVDVVAEELGGEVVLRRAARVAGDAAMQSRERVRRRRRRGAPPRRAGDVAAARRRCVAERRGERVVDQVDVGAVGRDRRRGVVAAVAAAARRCLGVVQRRRRRSSTSST